MRVCFAPRCPSKGSRSVNVYAGSALVAHDYRKMCWLPIIFIKVRVTMPTHMPSPPIFIFDAARARGPVRVFEWAPEKLDDLLEDDADLQVRYSYVSTSLAHTYVIIGDPPPHPPLAHPHPAPSMACCLFCEKLRELFDRQATLNSQALRTSTIHNQRCR